MESDKLKGKRVEILLVEDDPADVNMVQETFLDSKIVNHLNVVSNGELALDFLQRRGEFAAAPRPDMILLDIGLPKKSGLEVLAEIKADPDLRRIPVIMLTTSKAEADILTSYDLHANSFITKPVHLSEFIEMVQGIEEFWFEIVKLPLR